MKLRAIWKLIWARTYVVYTSRCFLQGTISYKADQYDMMALEDWCDDHIEAEESVEYVKSLLTEI